MFKQPQHNPTYIWIALIAAGSATVIFGLFCFTVDSGSLRIEAPGPLKIEAEITSVSRTPGQEQQR